jgi:hypothetical protein
MSVLNDLSMALVGQRAWKHIARRIERLAIIVKAFERIVKGTSGL